MRVKLYFALFICVLTVLQAELPMYLRPFHVVPDFLLVAACFAGLIFGPRWAALFGAACGFGKDIFGVTSFGLHAIVFCGWALAVRSAAAKIVFDTQYMRAALMAVISMTDCIFGALVVIASGASLSAGIFIRTAIISSLCSAAILPFYFYSTRRLFATNDA